MLAKYAIDHRAGGEGMETEGTCEREAVMEGVKESEGWWWVGADKAELWRINLSRVCFRASVVEGQALCSRALEVLSNIQTPCLPSHTHT